MIEGMMAKVITRAGAVLIIMKLLFVGNKPLMIIDIKISSPIYH